MMLVDPRWVDTSLQSLPLPDPLGQSLRELDNQMRIILERKDMTEHDKAQLYFQTLHRYMTRVNQYRDKPLGKVDIAQPQETNETASESTVSESADETSEIEKDVLKSVPFTLKKKATQLLHHLKQNTDLSWNERGEIVLHGQKVKNSNLIDLVNDVLRHRKQSEQPIGWATFAEALSRTNVAQELIGHPDRWKSIRSRMLKTEPQASESWEVTPKKKKKAKQSKKKAAWEEL